MRVLITDLFTGECELTGKKDAECVRVKLDETAPDAVIAIQELLRLLRFQKRQNDKQAQSLTKGTHS